MIIIFNSHIIRAEIADSEFQKLDPRLALIITKPEMKPLIFNQTLSKTNIRNNYINVLIKTSLTRPEITNFGFKVYSQIGDIVTCSVPVDKIEKFVNHSDVQYIQCAKLLSLFFCMLNL